MGVHTAVSILAEHVFADMSVEFDKFYYDGDIGLYLDVELAGPKFFLSPEDARVLYEHYEGRGEYVD